MKESLAKRRERALAIIEQLREATQGMAEPACDAIVAQYGRDPFLVLASCLLSLRTKDTTSLPASQRLFALARTPQEMLEQSQEAIQKAIYPVGFYRQKTAQLQAMCAQLIERWDGRVPSNETDLLSLPGVGRKTANLVLGQGFGIPAICVDVHVHRISNRLGLINTNTPEETERALQTVLPEKYWVEYNRLLVMWGQNICVPVAPFCSRCPIRDMCERRGVTRSR